MSFKSGLLDILFIDSTSLKKSHKIRGQITQPHLHIVADIVVVTIYMKMWIWPPILSSNTPMLTRLQVGLKTRFRSRV